MPDSEAEEALGDPAARGGRRTRMGWALRLLALLAFVIGVLLLIIYFANRDAFFFIIGYTKRRY